MDCPTNSDISCWPATLASTITIKGTVCFVHVQNPMFLSWDVGKCTSSPSSLSQCKEEKVKGLMLNDSQETKEKAMQHSTLYQCSKAIFYNKFFNAKNQPFRFLYVVHWTRRSSILSSFDRIIKSDFFCFSFSQSYLGDALWCLLPLRSSECAASTSHFFSLGHHTSMISLSQLISASLMMLSSSSHMSGFLLAPTYVLLPFHLIVLSVFFQNLHIELSWSLSHNLFVRFTVCCMDKFL